MSAEPCAYCTKPAYPIEQLKVLGKVYHKTCFKCTECKMTLNMKTFKGLDKMPYCEAHVPIIKHTHTGVYDTPQWRRRFRADHPLDGGKSEYDMEEEQLEVERESIRTRTPSPIQKRRSPSPVPDIPEIPRLTRQSTPPLQKKSKSKSSSGILKNNSKISPPVLPTNPGVRNFKSEARYRALYDYDACDVDELSFIEGDVIIDCTGVDQGWLTGTVQRTGRRGMLPANYVVYTH